MPWSIRPKAEPSLEHIESAVAALLAQQRAADAGADASEREPSHERPVARKPGTDPDAESSEA